MEDAEILTLVEPGKLKPCPWCGGEATIIQNSYESIGQGAIVRLNLFLKCSDCGSIPPKGHFSVSFEYHDLDVIVGLNSLNDAIRSWNRRDGDE